MPESDDFESRVEYYTRNISETAARRLAYFSDITKIGEIMLFMDDRIDASTVRELLGDAPISIMPKLIEVPKSVAGFNNIYSVRFGNYFDERLNDYDYIIQLDDDMFLLSPFSFESVLTALPIDIQLFCFQHVPENEEYRPALYYHHSPEINGKLKEFMQENFGRVYATDKIDAPFPAGGFQIMRNPYPEFEAFVNEYADLMLDDEVLLEVWKYGFEYPLGRLNELVPECWAPFYHDEYKQGFLNVGVPLDRIPDRLLQTIKKALDKD